MKGLQIFNDEYLEKTRQAKPEQILEFLEQYRLLQLPGEKISKSKLISMKIQEEFLKAFRARCDVEGVKYQTKIKQLMQDWLVGYK